MLWKSVNNPYSCSVVGLFIALQCSAHGLQSVNLAWNTSSDPAISGYRIHYGLASRVYTSTLEVQNTTTAVVPNLIDGVTYYFAASAYDSFGAESDMSKEVVYTAPMGNTPPTIALSAPTGGSSYVTDATVNLAASIGANGHTILKAQFYNGATLLGEDSSAPYGWTWSNVGAGSFTLSATLIYDAGSSVTSSPVNVVVTNPPPLGFIHSHENHG